MALGWQLTRYTRWQGQLLFINIHQLVLRGDGINHYNSEKVVFIIDFLKRQFAIPLIRLFQFGIKSTSQYEMRENDE
jgi:hypothetical protein